MEDDKKKHPQVWYFSGENIGFTDSSENTTEKKNLETPSSALDDLYQKEKTQLAKFFLGEERKLRKG